MFVIYHAVFHRFAVLKCGLRCIENHHPYRMEGKHFVEGLVFIYLIFLIIRLYFFIPAPLPNVRVANAANTGNKHTRPLTSYVFLVLTGTTFLPIELPKYFTAGNFL